MDTYLPQNCPYCHTASFGKNNDLRNYRSSGCTSCHFLYDAEGLSQSADPTIDGTEPGHPRVHQITTAIPTQQCEHCHFQGARIGLTYQGVREGGFQEPNEIKEKQTPWFNVGVHGNPLGGGAIGPSATYIKKEADDPFDQKTPPDIHCRKPGEEGDDCRMDCADCHTTRAVHGDGKMYSTAKGQLDIQCIDCHGTVAQRATPGVDGIFRTKLGTALNQLERDDEGTWLTTKRTGERLKVTQITDSIAARCQGDAVNFDPICKAKAPHDSGFSHTEEMECWTCHTRWRMNCLGCHVRENVIIKPVNIWIRWWPATGNSTIST